MNLLEKEHAIARGDGPSTYASITKAIEKMSVAESARLRRKFDIAHLIATEKSSYLKYPIICELEKKHRLDIGVAYTNERGCLYITLQKQGEDKQCEILFNFVGWLVTLTMKQYC